MRHLVTGFMGSLLLFVGACGGKVVVDSTGATGAGGAGGVSTTSTSSTTDTGNGGFVASTGDVSPVGVVSSSSGGMSLCEQVCADQMSKGCNQGGPQCVMSCIEAVSSAGMCEPQLDALLQCILTSSDTLCAAPVVCQPQVQAYQACMTPVTCGPTACGGGPNGNCDCSADCNGSKLEVQCQPGNAMDFCVCIKNGMPINKCTQPQGNGLSCDIVKGCCGKVFFP